MATITRTTWPRKDGSTGHGWKLSYFDKKGKRRRKNFETKAAADRYRVKVEAEIANGIFVSPEGSPTVIQGLQKWLDHLELLVKAGKRAHVTWDKYDEQVRLHIATRDIAAIKLCGLRTPACQEFVEDIQVKLSHSMALKVRSTLRTGLSHCARHGWIAANPMVDTQMEDLDREDTEIEIPEKTEVAAIIAQAEKHAAEDKGRALTLISVGFFAGPRPSELLAIERPALTLVGKDTGIRISQALDDKGRIQMPRQPVDRPAAKQSRRGLLKRKASHRTVPIGPRLVNTLKRWLKDGLAGGIIGEQQNQDGTKRQLHMLFPTKSGRPITYHNFYNKIWSPLLIAAGITTTAINKDGKEIEVARYTPNVMRHFAASLWIEQRVNQKRLQRRLGHADIKTTMNVYGHLFNDAERDQEEAAAAELSVLGVVKKE